MECKRSMASGRLQQCWVFCGCSSIEKLLQRFFVEERSLVRWSSFAVLSLYLLVVRNVGSIYGPKVPHVLTDVKPMFPPSVAQTDCTAFDSAQKNTSVRLLWPLIASVIKHKTASVSRKSLSEKSRILVKNVRSCLHNNCFHSNACYHRIPRWK